jgi:hypothetical protein
MVKQAQPVRAVILRSAIGALGEDDEIHTSLEMQGLTAAWMPGDHGLCLIVGGGVLDGVQIEPAVTVVIPPKSAVTLARTMSRNQKRNLPLAPGETVYGTLIGMGAPAIREGMYVRIGQSAWTQAYRAEVLPEAFPGRPYVVEIDADPFRFRIYLTKDEADDLKVVLKYQPTWYVA